MNRAGLVSITFRNKTPREIVALMKRAGLSQVEWGGDVHVKPGAESAAEVRRMTEGEGLRTSAYGSYYRLEENAFGPWLDEAEALGAPVIRVWAGRKGSAEVDEWERETLVHTLNDCVRQAAERNIVVSLEYHPNTLTDSRDSVRRLMRESEQFDQCLSLPIHYAIILQWRQSPRTHSWPRSFRSPDISRD